jgi:hypothetical protein
MGAYWQRVPGAQAMPGIWVYELEKRVRSGELSAEDARGIFETARLGAETQGFAPTGNTMSAVHNSAVDFLKKAEAVYFARKKKRASDEASGADQSGSARNSLPSDDAQIKHVFRDPEGHLPDTPEHRALLEEVANDPKSALGTDRHGKTWSARTLPDGSQVWTATKGGTIINGGVNRKPRTFHPGTGLSSPARPNS